MKRSSFYSCVVSLLLAAALTLQITGCGAATPGSGSSAAGSSASHSAESTPDSSPEGDTLLPDELDIDSSQFCVVIDAGHQRKGNSALEPVGPNAAQMKAKVSSGTVGRFSGLPEYELNLQVSLMLQAELERRNFRVVMTRTSHDVNISNAERAQMAADAGGDILVRIHANGSEDPSVHGAMTICMTKNNPYCSWLHAESRLLSKCILEKMTAATGSARRSIWETDTMTGINWSSIPVTIVEMGYMTNQAEDMLLADPKYQQKLALGIADGIEEFFRLPPPDDSDVIELEPEEPKPPEDPQPPEESPQPDLTKQPEESQQPNESDPPEEPTPAVPDQSLKQVITQSLSGRTDMWDVWCEDLRDGSVTTVQLNGAENGKMVAASLIKLFVMGAVFERIDQGTIDYSDVRSDLKNMIQVSDNNSTNRLIRRLGGGDADSGMAAVNSFAKSIGCSNTRLNRLMLANNGLENYTTAEDCAKILRMMYRGQCVSSKWSQEMLTILKGQQKNTKIPAQLPKGTVVANKTGTLTQICSGDVGIVFSPACDYIICIINNKSRNDAKTEKAIAALSLDVYRYYNT